MLVPILIFAAASIGAGYAAYRLLPALESSRVGILAFNVVVVLVAIAFAIVALEAYETIRTLAHTGDSGFTGVDKAAVLTAGLTTILRDAALPLGLAAAVYLLAPGDEDVASASGP